MMPYDRRYLALNVEHLVRQYNKYGIYNCNRCVFSRDGDLSVVDEVMKTEPEILDVPKTRLSWEEKAFSQDQNRIAHLHNDFINFNLIKML